MEKQPFGRREDGLVRRSSWEEELTATAIPSPDRQQKLAVDETGVGESGSYALRKPMGCLERREVTILMNVANSRRKEKGCSPQRGEGIKNPIARVVDVECLVFPPNPGLAFP